RAVAAALRQAGGRAAEGPALAEKDDEAGHHHRAGAGEGGCAGRAGAVEGEASGRGGLVAAGGWPGGCDAGAEHDVDQGAGEPGACPGGGAAGGGGGAGGGFRSEDGSLTYDPRPNIRSISYAGVTSSWS